MTQARRFFMIFLREVIRIREIRSAAAFHIQRLFRGWVKRRVVERLIVERFKAGLLAQHLKSRFDMAAFFFLSAGIHVECDDHTNLFFVS